MSVTVPLVLVVGVLVFIAWRYLGLKLWHALIALLFGFLLAATALAPDIRAAIGAALNWITGK
ncbi:hypothetical protein SAMN05444920_12473 [Nonomuraea solani]|uniref:Uncharacterized protein n=1 Tax=Nonomuraea solani TaxID=1144553 RepID=A0A1H6EWB9_9ACTN|nr:hypothetical protein [Nonomuraea solani]SEH02138.1 hypothetical protein SAMN05444920_12473 [Nonomuraea solani]